jgi:hypothetical protein
MHVDRDMRALRASRPVVVAAIAAGIALSGCGATAGDLIAIDVSGGAAARHERIRVSDDGRASCDGHSLEAIPSQTLLDAREAARELKKPAERGAAYTATGAGRRRYTVHTADGTVSWVEGAPGPAVLGRAALLTLRLERALCRPPG